MFSIRGSVSLVFCDTDDVTLSFEDLLATSGGWLYDHSDQWVQIPSWVSVRNSLVNSSKMHRFWDQNMEQMGGTR